MLSPIMPCMSHTSEKRNACCFCVTSEPCSPRRRITCYREIQNVRNWDEYLEKIDDGLPPRYTACPQSSRYQGSDTETGTREDQPRRQEQSLRLELLDNCSHRERLPRGPAHIVLQSVTRFPSPSLQQGVGLFAVCASRMRRNRVASIAVQGLRHSLALLIRNGTQQGYSRSKEGVPAPFYKSRTYFA